VDEHRQHLLGLRIVAPAHAPAAGALHHGIDDLQVRGIERQRHVQGAAGRLDIRGETQVVLHVPGALHLVGLIALELGEQVTGILAQDIGQHVEPAAVGHAQDDLPDALAAGALQQVVEQRDQGISPLEGEALLAHVLGVQVLLDALGGDQPLQELLLARRRQPRPAALPLEPLLDPALLHRIGDVHVLRAHRPAVDPLEPLDDIAEGQLIRRVERAGIEGAVQVRLGEPVVGRVEIRHRRLRPQVERVDVRGLVAAEAVGVDQPQHRRLLLGGLGAKLRRRRRRRTRRAAAVGAPVPLEALPDRGVGHVRSAVAFLGQGPEVGAPLRIHAARILQVGLVEVLDEGRIGTVEIRGAAQAFE